MEALERCRSVQQLHGPSAELFSLLGILNQARGDADEASRSFRKALYLQPEHAEALMHLMLLCHEKGDFVQEALLRRRLERLGPGGTP
jgi:chemotaxis protein methyltransferase WspC